MNRVCSIFSQLLRLFPRLEFEKAVKEHRAERHARGFTCWGQFVAMLFCHLGKAQSLREICGGLAASEGKLRHLGVPRAPKRSTLSYANEHRPWELYRSVFQQLLERCQGVLAPRKKFRFKNKLMSLDASTIELCAQIYDWARFGRSKGAVKLHLLLDHEGYLPSFAVIEPARRPEVEVAREFHFSPGTILVVDRGYIDFNWFRSLAQEGVFFVTRMRCDLVFEVKQRRERPQNSNIRVDQVVLVGSPKHDQLEIPLRRIKIWDAEKREMITLLSNHLEFGATTLAAIYKDRWQIELFFKALKQSFRVKTFVGTSANALKTQIWTALIALLLLKYLQLQARYGWSLSNLVALLRQQLFVYRDLWTWLDSPYQPPSALEGIHDAQLALSF